MPTDEDRPVGRFSTLPRRIRLDETITSQDTEPVPDPEGGRDTDKDFLVRYGFG